MRFRDLRNRGPIGVAVVTASLLSGCAGTTPAASPGTTAAAPATMPAASARELTLYEVADVVALADNTPVRFSPLPPVRLEKTPGPGDVIVLESTLYAGAKDRTTNTNTEPPAAIPGATLPTGDYQTFDATGDKAGSLQGTCTFIRVNDRRPASDDRSMACNVTLVLADGSLTYGGLLDVDDLEAARPTTVPIVGGTGTYPGARGTLTIIQPSIQAFDRFRLTVRLTP